MITLYSYRELDIAIDIVSDCMRFVGSPGIPKYGLLLGFEPHNLKLDRIKQSLPKGILIYDVNGVNVFKVDGETKWIIYLIADRAEIAKPKKMIAVLYNSGIDPQLVWDWLDGERGTLNINLAKNRARDFSGREYLLISSTDSEKILGIEFDSYLKSPFYRSVEDVVKSRIR